MKLKINFRTHTSDWLGRKLKAYTLFVLIPLIDDDMRRIDVIGIGLGVFGAGGLLYLGLQVAGLDTMSAGIWSQVLLIGGLVGWLLSYAFRAVSGQMTYHQQVKNYEQAVLQKRLEELTPEQLDQMCKEIEQHEQSLSSGESQK